MKVFIDSSFFIALLCQEDSCHGRALSALEETREKNNFRFFTSFYVIDETLTLLAMRVSKQKALDFLLYTESTDSPRVLEVDKKNRQASGQSEAQSHGY